MNKGLKLIALFMCIVLFCSCGNFKTLKTKTITNKITQTKVITESKIKENEIYTEFFKSFKASHILPGLFEGLIPQCLCYDENSNNLIISGYFEEEKFPTMVITVDYDSGKLIGAYSLKTTNGDDCFKKITGIAVSHNTVYLTGDGECYTFPLNDLKEAKNDSIIQCKAKFKLNTTGSFATVENNILWVGDYFKSDEKAKETAENITTLPSGETFYAYCEGYELKDGLPQIKKINKSSNGYIPDYMLAIPEETTGLGFSKSGKLIFTTSSDKYSNSKIIVFNDIFMNEKAGTIKIDNNNIDLIACSSEEKQNEFITPPLLNGLCTHPEGVYLLFSSGAYSFRQRGCKNPIDTLYTSNIE